MTFLFGTGIECSYPTVAGGRRIDQMDTCGHYARWEEDFELVREMGLRALHYGPAYYRTHVAPDRFDWDTCDDQMRRLHLLGVEVVADLCHFGVPSWLGGFQDPAFPVLFAGYARAFARRYPWVRYYTPVHEIFTCALNSALRGWWNECLTSEAAFVRALRNLCMAHELAVEAILAERPDAVIVQRECGEEWRAVDPAAAADAERWNALTLLPLDLTTGREPAAGMLRLLHAHGVASNDLSFFRERRARGQRWLALDVHPRGEHEVAVGRAVLSVRQRASTQALLSAYARRYDLPLYQIAMGHAESGEEFVRDERDAGAPIPFPALEPAQWLLAQWEDMLAVRTAGIPVYGFAWYSLTDQMDWQSALRDPRGEVHPVGLFDLNREIRPVGEKLECIVRRWSLVLDIRNVVPVHAPRLEMVRG